MIITDTGRTESAEDIIKELRDRVNCHNGIILGLSERLKNIEHCQENIKKNMERHQKNIEDHISLITETINIKIKSIPPIEQVAYKIILLESGEEPILLDLKDSKRLFPKKVEEYQE